MSGIAHCHPVPQGTDESTLQDPGRAMPQDLSSFLAHTDSRPGAELPRFIKSTFVAFLERGILVHGVLRLRLRDCGHDWRRFPLMV
jgi:hypothetical protein